jgi:hypothetical protein
MQTFLPYVDFYRSSIVLDNKRLGKQRLEAFQILNAIRNPNNGWRKHPAIKMWIGFEDALIIYMNIMVAEWTRRGFKNTMKIFPFNTNCSFPLWLRDERLHSSHRAALLFKNPTHYSRFRWAEEPGIKYFWPV